jgi:hypothetical protein
MMHADVPVLRSLAATAVELPMRRPLGTSAKSIDKACLLLVDLLTQTASKGMPTHFVTSHRSLVRWCRLWPNWAGNWPAVPFSLSTLRTRFRGTLGFPA